MVNKDYRKEIGVKVPSKSVPRAVAIVVLVAVAGVATFSITRVIEAGKKRHEAKQTAPAAAPVTPAD